MISYSTELQHGVGKRRLFTLLKACVVLGFMCCLYMWTTPHTSAVLDPPVQSSLDTSTASTPLPPATEEKQNSTSSKTLAIVTIVTDTNNDLAQASIADKQAYVAKHGYTFLADPPSVPHRPVVWSKFASAAHAFDEGYEWVWLLDLDTVITNHEVQLHRLAQYVGAASNYSLIIAKDCNEFNAGSFLLRNNQWSRDFLAIALDTYGKEVPVDHPFQEQMAIIHLYHHNETIKAQTLLAPQWAINSYEGDCVTDKRRWQIGDFVVHFAGYPRDQAYHDIYFRFLYRAQAAAAVLEGFDTETWLKVIRSWWVDNGIAV
ncbi:hypothetical protein RI367_003839 [Sorochytrium milnesiophthora]